MSFSEDLKEYKRIAKNVDGSEDSEVLKRYFELYESLSNILHRLAKNQKAIQVEVNADSAQSYYGTYADAIFEIEGKLFKLTFNMDSWRDHERFGDLDLESNIVEVRPVERVVTVYEEVKDE